MNLDNKFAAVFASMMIVSGLTACDKPGPAESAGKKIDQTTENVSSAVSNSANSASANLEKQGEKVGQAIDDTEITAKIKALLLNEPGLKSLKISVETSKGVVTLSGLADTQDNIAKAINLAEKVPGVMSVKDKISLIKK